MKCGVCDSATGRPCVFEAEHSLPHRYTAAAQDDPEPDPTPMKDGKLMMELVDLDFVADMARQLQQGLKGQRVPEGWRNLDADKWLPKYRGAVLRHLRLAHVRGSVDAETGASHWAGVAVNAMICWGLERLTSEPAGFLCPLTAKTCDRDDCVGAFCKRGERS